jgi:anaerobic selenocysteine-containing dehydrogenase
VDDDPISIPEVITGLLVPEWETKKCIGCRECELDVCPYDVVQPTIKMKTRKEVRKKRMFLQMNPVTAELYGLSDGDRIDIESVRGRVEGVLLETTEDIDPRIVWSSDGWWVEDGNVNNLTDDKHTAFGSTPGFNSVLVRVLKSKH